MKDSTSGTLKIIRPKFSSGHCYSFILSTSYNNIDFINIENGNDFDNGQWSNTTKLVRYGYFNFKRFIKIDFGSYSGYDFPANEFNICEIKLLQDINGIEIKQDGILYSIRNSVKLYIEMSDKYKNRVFSYLWNDSKKSTSNYIYVSEPKNYNVTLRDEDLNCQNTYNINVNLQFI